jgi:hypothetical protein
MQTHVSLLAFLESGEFGGVHLGMSRAEVEGLFGPPDDVGGTSRRYRVPSIWKYGSFELHFQRPSGVLALVYSDHLGDLSGGLRLELDAGGISEAMALSKAEAMLRSRSIGYSLAPYRWEPWTDEVVTVGGVSLLFTGTQHTPRENRQLAVIQHGHP